MYHTMFTVTQKHTATNRDQLRLKPSPVSSRVDRVSYTLIFGLCSLSLSQALKLSRMNIYIERLEEQKLANVICVIILFTKAQDAYYDIQLPPPGCIERTIAPIDTLAQRNPDGYLRVQMPILHCIWCKCNWDSRLQRLQVQVCKLEGSWFWCG